MEVKLLEHTKLSTVVAGVNVCYDLGNHRDYDIPTDDVTKEDKTLLNNLINVKNYAGISGHVIYSFTIKGIQRSCNEVLTRYDMPGCCSKSFQYIARERSKVDLFWTLDIRHLMVFLGLGLSNDAHPDVGELADHILKEIPQGHLFLFERFLSADDVRYGRLKLEKYIVR